jgi:sec-independent protein translocase protein TatB
VNIFGVGSAELVLLLLMGGVILGPRRLVGLARDAGKFVGQIRSLTAELTRQVNREVNLLDLAEGNKRASAARDPAQPEAPAPRLPEAYQRFRDDFPDEGQIDHIGAEPVASPVAPPVAPPPETADPSPAGQ